MKKTIISTILVLVLLATAGIAYAAWEDTQSTQVTVNILPSPGDTFRIVSAFCNDAVRGYGAECVLNLVNESSTIATVDTLVVTSENTFINITSVYGIGNTFEPGQTHQVGWFYESDLLCEPGVVTLNVEVTCLGDGDG